MSDDTLKEAKERYHDARDAMNEFRDRIVEDLKFSNPADPQQWDDAARNAREKSPGGARPCMTFDQTNQYIAQVVNDGRQNKPAINVVPGDSKASVKTANILSGLIRQIEYVSRAGIAYDTALEHAARVGLGWMRVLPIMTNAKQNEQEIRIDRIHDVLSVTPDPDWTQPDGSDMQYAYIETTMSKRAFERKYKGRGLKTQSWDDNGWFSEDSLRVCEYFRVIEKNINVLVVQGPEGVMELTEDEYWELVPQIGFKPVVISSYDRPERSVKWSTMTGDDIIEETDFPSRWLPVIPVIGNEIWIEGKRYLSGLTRRMMDAQKAYNYERSADIETKALQPKAPYLAAWESIENFEEDWRTANTTNRAALYYNALDDEGNALPRPQREQPPQASAAYQQGGIQALEDLQASIGMYRANLGAPSNEKSGVAIARRQRQGDIANFHYVDNLARSIEHLGRIVVDMIPRLYDTQRVASILGEDNETSVVMVDPGMDTAYRQEGEDKVINPTLGTYGVRVKVGPSFNTMRQETAESLGNILSANPAAFPILGAEWVKMQDWPGADRVARKLAAMAPPQIQAIDEEDEQEQLPPAAAAKMQAMQQQMQQMGEALQQAKQQIQGETIKAQADMAEARAKAEIDWYKAETERMKALQPAIPPEQVAALAAQIVMQALNGPQPGQQPSLAPGPQGMQPPMAPPGMQPPGPPMAPQQVQPAQAGFFTPEQVPPGAPAPQIDPLSGQSSDLSLG